MSITIPTFSTSNWLYFNHAWKLADDSALNAVLLTYTMAVW